jgi:hypothetical protein
MAIIAPPVWITDLAISLVNLINYGITVVILMFIYEVFQLFSGPAKDAGKHLTDWKKSPVLNAIKRRRKNAHVGQLNEMLVEEKELGLVENVLAAVELAKNEMDVLQTKTEFTTQIEYDENLGKGNRGAVAPILKRTPKNKIVLIELRITKAIKYLRNVKKRTWRQRSKTGELIKKLEKDGKSSTNLIALENNILKLHEETKEELRKAEVKLKKLRAAQKAPAAGAYPAPISTSGLLKEIQEFHTQFNDAAADTIRKDVEEAVTKQRKAIEHVQGIIVECRSLYQNAPEHDDED